MKPVSVVIVDDQRAIREGLAALIGGTPGFRCTGVFAGMEGALPVVRADAPDILLVDLGLPGVSGPDGIRMLRRGHPESCIVVLTVYEDDERIFEALCAGACGCVPKKTPPGRLIAALRQVVRGGALMSPETAQRLLGMLGGAPQGSTADWTLDTDEREILERFAQGHNLETAAADLGIPVERVAAETRRVYDKLHLFSQMANMGA